MFRSSSLTAIASDVVVVIDDTLNDVERANLLQRVSVDFRIMLQAQLCAKYETTRYYEF